jgi:hypothetical protein
MVYAQGRVEPRSLRTFAGGLLPVHSGTDQAYTVGYMHLDHAEYFALLGCVDCSALMMAWAMSRTLTWPFLGEAHQQ